MPDIWALSSAFFRSNSARRCARASSSAAFRCIASMACLRYSTLPSPCPPSWVRRGSCSSAALPSWCLPCSPCSPFVPCMCASSSSSSNRMIVGRMCRFHAGTTMPARPTANNSFVHAMGMYLCVSSATSATAVSNAFSHAKPIKMPILLTIARTTSWWFSLPPPCSKLSTCSRMNIINNATTVTASAKETSFIMPCSSRKMFADMAQSIPKNKHHEKVMPMMFFNCAVSRGIETWRYKRRIVSKRASRRPTPMSDIASRLEWNTWFGSCPSPSGNLPPIA
mmetsp:Transcript_114144/g.327933  ORF Transcript_114144/g.327933 Transcript_114144/m.327933 type:complete len:281 (+) Transcript_114144:153-995(+)